MASHFGLSQDQLLADSLVSLYHSGHYTGELLPLLKEIAINETNPDRKLEFSELLISKATPDSIFDFLHTGYLQKGNALRAKGDFAPALTAYFESINLAKRVDNQTGVGKLTISIADTYSQMGNSRNAEIYYNQGIQLLRNSNDSISLATALLNAGDEYFNSRKYDSAILYFSESGPIFRKLNYLIGTAYNLGNLGMVYAEQGKDSQAEININEAITILEQLQDYYPIAVYLIYMADIYQRKGNLTTALAYAKRSLDLAHRYHLKDQISEANLKLSQLHEQVGDTLTSYKFFKNHILYRDSLQSLETIQKMADLRTDYEVAQKQVEIDLQKQKQKIIVVATSIALLLIALLAFGLYRRYVFIKTTNKIIEAEKNRSEALLLNILPEETAVELKRNGRVQAKKFASSTVLFTDFVGFTKLAESNPPEQLVMSIDYYFKAFDEITSKYGLEKIKTIGDAYMCAGGLPVENTTHPVNAVRAAQEMIRVVESTRTDGKLNILPCEIRIGIHTGPVVAGIVGNKKWQYDIWGDTVNIASRMEANSSAGRINLSETTFEKIKEEFPCVYRGEVQVKNRGFLKMYYLA